MMLDPINQCDFDACWCKQEQPEPLIIVLNDIAILKHRMEEAIALMAKIESKLEHIKPQRKKKSHTVIPTPLTDEERKLLDDGE